MAGSSDLNAEMYNMITHLMLNETIYVIHNVKMIIKLDNYILR